jgi:ribosomal-protein-alanine N-acetyltransferase
MIMITHKGTRILNTERLLLRRILPDDANMVYTWMGDPDVCKYEKWQPHPNADYSRGYIHEVFNEYKSERLYHWGMELEGNLIGSVCVVNVDDNDQKAVLGFCLARKFWSNGYTTEAVKAVMNYMFTEIDLNRLEASHSVNNIASGKVLEKVGMTLEGYAEDYYFCNLGFQDSNLYAITRAQFFTRIIGNTGIH